MQICSSETIPIILLKLAKIRFSMDSSVKLESYLEKVGEEKKMVCIYPQLEEHRHGSVGRSLWRKSCCGAGVEAGRRQERQGWGSTCGSLGRG